MGCFCLNILFFTTPQLEHTHSKPSSFYAICIHVVAACIQYRLECGPMPNVMASLPNTGGVLCWTPQFGWRSLLECRAVLLPIFENAKPGR